MAAYLLAAGYDEWIDAAYIAQADVLMAAGVYWSANLFVTWGRSPWWSLLTLLLPAMLTSIHRMVLDGPFAALVAAFLLTWERGQRLRCAALAGLAMGMRETGALLVIALAVDALFRREWRQLTGSAVMAFPAAAWILMHYRPIQSGQGIGILGWPLIGHASRLLESWPDGAGWRLTTAEAAQRIALAGLLVAVALAAQYLVNNRWRAPEWALAGFCLLALGLASPAHLRESFGFARPVTPLLVILAWTGIRDSAPMRAAACFVPSLPILMTFGSDALRMAAALFRA